MRIIIAYFIVITFSFLAHFAIAAPSDFQQQANFICKQIKPKPSFIYEDHFHKQFRQVMSYEDLIKMLSQLANSYGSCTHTVIKSTPIGSHGTFQAITTNKSHLNFSLDISSEPRAHLITGMYFLNPTSPPAFNFKNFNEINTVLTTLSGKVAVNIKFWDQDKTIFSFNDNAKLAIGSVFKLYVLKGLLTKIQNNEFKWDDVYPIKPELVSLPPNIIQTLPNSPNLTIYDLALAMIAISDNTATDLLINCLGREYLENQISPIINSFKKENIPLITTQELFKMRLWNQAKVNDYTTASLTRRRAILSKLKSTPLPNVDDLPTRPTDINKLGWFASAKDVSNTLQQLYIQTLTNPKLQTQVLQILSNNSLDTFDITTTNLKFLGFKGGSEPGVLSYAYLFKTKRNRFGSLVLIWNNEKDLLSREIFSEIAHGILKFLDKF